MKRIAYLIITLGIFFNLYLYFPETQILSDPNDNIFQFALVNRTNEVWQESSCPLSFSCIPNLIDHWVPNWAEGYSLPFYYSHAPQIATVASYRLLVKPVSDLFHLNFSLKIYYNWTKYLLFCLFPLSVFIALRIVGFNPLLSALSAVLSGHLSTNGLYGVDPPSYLWRGYGLTSQLYGTFFIPLAIAFTFRALRETTADIGRVTRAKASREELRLPGDEDVHDWSTLNRAGIGAGLGAPACAGRRERQDPPKINYVFWAILFTTLSIAGHLGIGVILVLTLPIFLFIDTKVSHIKLRFKTLAVIIGVSLFTLSYWIIPVLLQDKYHLISFWDPLWKFNSYGWYEVIRKYFSGEIFDWQRFPTVTLLATIGLFVLLIHEKYFPFAFIFIFWILMYFGRTTWGGLIDIIPGMKDFHLSRFIVGVQISSFFILPGGFGFIFYLSGKISRKIFGFFINLKNPPFSDKLERTAGLSVSIALIFAVFFLTVKQSVSYAYLNNKWVPEANDAYKYSEKDFNRLIETLKTLPAGRIYAGRPGNWGRDFKFSSTQMYMAVSVLGFPISGFLPESWSPNSDNEEMFDERMTSDYNLYNLRYIVAPSKFTPPKEARFLNTFGPFYLYGMPTTGYFDIASSNIVVDTDKNSFVDIVHVWQKSFVRYWNMYPLINLEKHISPPVNRTLTMTDLTDYRFNGKEYNLFGTFPFSFPEATVSGKIKDLSNDKPYTAKVYKAEVNVPPNCKNCFTVFKMTYFPNWQAALDGKPVAKWNIFPFYSAVLTPPGKHTVEFSYHPSTVKIILLLLEPLVFLAYLFRKKIKNRLPL